MPSLVSNCHSHQPEKTKTKFFKKQLQRKTKKRNIKRIADLNRELVRYSDHGDLFDRRMVCYADAPNHGSSVFRSPFG